MSVLYAILKTYNCIIMITGRQVFNLKLSVRLKNASQKVHNDFLKLQHIVVESAGYLTWYNRFPFQQ